MTLKIEEGKYYRTANGYKAGPAVFVTRSGVSYWTMPVTAPTIRTTAGYIANGTFLGGRDIYGNLDLVAEWQDEPAAEEQVEQEAEAALAQETFGDLERYAPNQVKREAGRKYDVGKTRFDLIAPEFLTGTADILAFGADKYGERNWEAGMSWSRPFAALMRHMWAWWAGESNDAETGKSHLWHAACCLMFLIAFEARNTGKDDRAKISH